MEISANKTENRGMKRRRKKPQKRRKRNTLNSYNACAKIEVLLGYMD